MVFSRLISARGFATSALRRGESAPPPPGDNLPFSINNRYKLTLYFILFFGSGLTVPFYAIRHQILKKQNKMSEDEDEGYISFGKPLKEFTEGENIRKRPISVEEQIATDQNGKRRFHGAFTGGFSAGFFNTVDTPQGWAPAQFKSRRGETAGPSGRKEQRPEDFMDDEDFGNFGFAPQALKTKSKFQTKDGGDANRAERREETKLTPVLTQLIQPTLPTIGESLLRKQGWKPGQGIGPKANKKTKNDRKSSYAKTYGSGNKKTSADSDNEDEILDKYRDFMFAPDDLPVYVASPKENMFGIGYKGLERPSEAASRFQAAASSNSLFSVKTGLHKKKFSISGEAFGVGAYEEEDQDVYSRPDMAQYDFSLDVGGKSGDKHASSSSTTVRSTGSSLDKLTEVLDGFTLSTRRSLLLKSFTPPRIPKDWRPSSSGYVKKSRFDDSSRGEPVKHSSNLTRDQRRSALFPDQAANRSEKNDLKEEIKSDIKQELEEIPDFLLNDGKPPASSMGNFKPFQSDPDKQKRYEQFLICIKNNRRDALRILQPKKMTEWERERERVEFERAAHLYKPMNVAIASRFVSSGSVKEDGTVDDQTALQTVKDEKCEEEVPKDKRRAAEMKMFGKLTRETSEWVPAKILCVRFNVKNPFNNAREHEDKKKRPIFESNQLFSLLGSGAQKRNTDREDDTSDDVKDEKSPENTQKEHEVKTENIVLVKDEPEIDSEKPSMDLFKAIFADSDESSESGESSDNGELNDDANHDDSLPDTMKAEKRRRSPGLDAASSRTGKDNRTGVRDDAARGIFAGINFDKFVKRRRKTPPPVIPVKALTSRPKSILDRSVRNILGIKSGDISDDEYGPVAPPPAVQSQSIVISSGDDSDEWEERDKSKKKKKKSKHKKEKKNKKKKKKHKSSKSDSD